MLESIYVKNLALIDEAYISPGRNLNIMTGETGAGKSIIIGSVGIALGQRASKDIIRSGTEYASVELDFRVENEDILSRLRALDLPVEDDHVIVSRRISSGRSVSRINGEVVSLSLLKSAAALLIDIHGQHEHQSLLYKENHLAIVDKYAAPEIGDLKERLSAAYRSWSALKKEMEGAIVDDKQRKSEADFLEFQVHEIEAANLAEGEDEILDRSFRKMNNAREMLEGIGLAHQYTGGMGGSSASDSISRALKEIYPLEKYDEDVASLISMLSDIESLLDDFNRGIAEYEDSLSFDEQTYKETEERIDLIEGLKSKYGNSIPEILKYADEAYARLEKLSDYENYLASLKMQLEAAEKEMQRLAGELSGIRKKKSEILQEQIKKALLDLNFADVRFAIRIEEAKVCGENGKDIIEFLISTNPGEDMKPLGDVASGGELSRIMLAIKSVLADADEIETLIFDEIDTGISGRTAQKVSEKMAVIAGNHQVICITHLPQIAAMADTHFVIDKQVTDGRTATQIRLLSERQSVEEIARLLGGVHITDAVLENAKEMKEMADSMKSSCRSQQ